MIQRLQKTCRELLETGKVDVVIGYGQKHPELPPYPVFVTAPDEVGQLVWNAQCVMNLTTYLTRKEVKALGRPAIIVKGCDAKALIVLEKESQIDRSQIVVIGVACQGVIGGHPVDGQDPRAATAAKCKVCDVHMPPGVDITLGETDSGPVTAAWRYSDLDAFMDQTPEERMAFWQEEFERCIKCYACRQVCPLCYCEQCVVDKNRPTRVSTSASLKGNYAWHITRAFHLAGRCIGCDECTRACPAGIDLRLLNLSLARAAEENFGYRAGYDPQAEAVIGAFSEQDKESFIG
ncbi:MAG TPA: 4Fe-4S dicluster domain-containing protein [Phycisphaerae bacterium]|nr:4Fe-4S dicluster domain-containing protein [Phycisphaerae bacterium]HOJ72891.1 4Fe-4S dicluster domain-containing protein [Phycisphaerae bacterium]HOM50075.1 4Fe-4S dicluster domain-containing protein [Phycisphaerae bacterium]HON66066.1 4Fe-4S dicluster domain-containing protein [Phycisphaerae bacterium]HPP26622.1 4Fe-4S dicluster domain-containing protein [Phycisphaerae bacterium]